MFSKKCDMILRITLVFSTDESFQLGHTINSPSIFRFKHSIKMHDYNAENLCGEKKIEKGKTSLKSIQFNFHFYNFEF